MAIRTYIPYLIALVRTVCVYTARHDSRIRANLSGVQLTAYELLRVGCDAFSNAVPVPPKAD